MSEVIEGSPDIQDASIPQEPGDSTARAHEALFGGTDPAPEEPAAPPAEGVAAPATEAAELPPAEDDADTRISRLYAQATQSEQQMRQMQTQNRQLQDRLNELEAQDKAFKDDPFTAMQKRGVDPQDWVKRTLGLDGQPPTPEELAAQANKRVEQIEQTLKDQREQATQQRTQQEQQQLYNQVTTFLDSNGFKALKTSGPAVASIAQKLYEMKSSGAFSGQSPEAIEGYCKKLAQDFDTRLSQEVTSWAGAEGAIDRLLANEATANLLREKLGVAAPTQPTAGKPPTPQAVTGNEPRTISDQIATQTVPPANGDGSFNVNEARRRAAAAITSSFTETG